MGLGTTAEWVLKEERSLTSKQGEGMRTFQAEGQCRGVNPRGPSEKQDSSLGKAAKCPACIRWPPSLAAVPEGTAARENKRRQASCLGEGAQEAGGLGVKLTDPKEGVRR